MLKEESARHGVPIDPATMPRKALDPDFPDNLLHDLSYAYTVVFLAAVVLVALDFILVMFLPKRQAEPLGRQDTS
ncbi:hypothetical protein [Mycobacterium tilburgii]|uniref:hypothetical protein n=1 Tax=Mycobacterium tilburgii TaxID=44467 RepID=UPI003898FC76